MDIILILKLILFCINIYSIFINFLMPFVCLLKGYKPYFLRNKNISTNINHATKTCYFHLFLFFVSCASVIVLIYDNWNLIIK